MRLLLQILIFIICCCELPANAGITIHYEGTAKSSDAVTKVIALVTATAEKNKWKVEDASDSNGRLGRVIDENEKDYVGRIRGVVIRVSENCDPLYFQFGDDLFMQSYVKTHFAGATAHIAIIELLESIQPYFKSFNIIDEGEYLKTRSRSALDNEISKLNEMMNEIKQKNQKAHGPVRLKSGRIVDLIE